jgi:hypothetical protein
MNDNTPRKLAATRVQNTLQIPRQDAFRLIDQAKTDDLNWGQTADEVIAAKAGPGLFPEGAQ